MCVTEKPLVQSSVSKKTIFYCIKVYDAKLSTHVYYTVLLCEQKLSEW